MINIETAFDERAKDELFRIYDIEEKSRRLMEAYLWSYHQATLVVGQGNPDLVKEIGEDYLRRFFSIYYKIISNEDGSNQAVWIVPSKSSQEQNILSD